MKILKWLIPILLLCGCSTTMPPPENDILLPEIDVIQVKENSDEALKIAQETKLDVEVLTAKVADLSNQILNLREDIKPVSPARIEELENRILVLTEELRLAQSNLSKVPVVTKKKKGKVRKTADGFAPTESMKTESFQDKQEKRYKAATALFNKGKFIQATKGFQETIKLAPGGRYAPDCHYWIGVSHFNLNDYANAIASFQKVFTFTRSQKRDDAQLKLGACYEKLGDAPQALLEYKKLINDYPNSEYIKLAEKYIRKLEP